jgi:hypothetical protein
MSLFALKRTGCGLFPLAVLTFMVGCFVGGGIGTNVTFSEKNTAVYAPLPHSVPPSPDATPFKFAMVHDVIHERYPRNGPAYYEERERLAREKMRDFHPESETAFALTDDIAVGLDRRGRTDEATAMMRDKLKRQQQLKLEKRDLYSSYANLGEFLIRGNLWAMGGKAKDMELAKEGLAFLRESLAVNPKAHFGREVWQIIAVEFFVDASQAPELLRDSDLIGNRLESGSEFPAGLHGMRGRPYSRGRTEGVFFRSNYEQELTGAQDPKQVAEFREYIAQVGREPPLKEKETSERGKRAPFDEPAMWLIGEWRQGSGPNPHYALCLGEIMLRVGQRYLAWNCYERASRMAEQFWPTAGMQQFLRNHCKSRQTAIEKSLPDGEVAELRPKFDKELAFGEAYQRDYQAYAEEKIQSGANLNDPHFFDEFHEKRGPIASKVGPEEWYAGTRPGHTSPAQYGAFFRWGILSGGASVLLMGLLMTMLRRKPPGSMLHSTANGHA